MPSPTHTDERFHDRMRAPKARIKGLVGGVWIEALREIAGVGDGNRTRDLQDHNLAL